MEDMTIVDLKDLRTLGIKYSRTHLFERLIPNGKFPPSFQLVDDPKGRHVWWRHKIYAWLKSRDK